ncbi:hypothetical protein CVIRNUC_007777 [Coccomyxa viridis]|uniref:F-box domain-containing protein n=1 Tax=Coccomyxa viridis TaxID=1274662 RepID=A0AAV1IFA2_9CHLO|nr:hypothetical protein CVIRNUC_007777 [Coccomyxa viridis]
MVEPTRGIDDVLFNTDILEGILGHLYHPDAVRLLAVCKTLRSKFRSNNIEHRPRLLVIASEANHLCEIDLLSGELGRTWAIRSRARGWKRLKGSSLQYWPTCVATSPDGYIHICQYKGHQVLKFSPSDLSYVSISAQMNSEEKSPEGIAFSKGCMYIASAAAGHIRRFAPNPAGQGYVPMPDYLVAFYDSGRTFGRIGRGLQVPWGMVTGPDGNLYIAMDDEYENGDDALASTSGHVMVGLIGADGQLVSLRPFCGLNELLARPSGVCFDDQGNLYVTCMTSRILQYSGPLSSKPGQLMRVAAQWTEPGEARGEGGNKPWDVRWHRGIAGICAKHEPLLIVTRHAGIWQRCGSNIAIFSAVSGRLLKQLKFGQEHCRYLRQLNMMLID